VPQNTLSAARKHPSLRESALVLSTLISHLYGQRRVEPHWHKGLGMKKELLTVKEMAAELRMSPKSIQRA
jgi:hypothetical protein